MKNFNQYVEQMKGTDSKLTGVKKAVEASQKIQEKKQEQQALQQQKQQMELQQQKEVAKVQAKAGVESPKLKGTPEERKKVIQQQPQQQKLDPKEQSIMDYLKKPGVFEKIQKLLSI